MIFRYCFGRYFIARKMKRINIYIDIKRIVRNDRHGKYWYQYDIIITGNAVISTCQLIKGYYLIIFCAWWSSVWNIKKKRKKKTKRGEKERILVIHPKFNRYHRKKERERTCSLYRKHFHEKNLNSYRHPVHFVRPI